MSESNKFTPGPWSVPHFASDGTSCNCSYIFSDSQSGFGSIAEVRFGGEDESYEIAKSNARLIADAPDLLEALEQMIDEYGTAGDGWPRNNKVLRDARAAILKARGQQ